MLVGGATLVLFPLAWWLRKSIGLGSAEFTFGFLTFYGAYFINDPHFAVTYLLFYKDGRDLRDREHPSLLHGRRRLAPRQSGHALPPRARGGCRVKRLCFRASKNLIGRGHEAKRMAEPSRRPSAQPVRFRRDQKRARRMGKTAIASSLMDRGSRVTASTTVMTNPTSHQLTFPSARGRASQSAAITNPTRAQMEARSGEPGSSQAKRAASAKRRMAMTPAATRRTWSWLSPRTTDPATGPQPRGGARRTDEVAGPRCNRPSPKRTVGLNWCTHWHAVRFIARDFEYSFSPSSGKTNARRRRLSLAIRHRRGKRRFECQAA
jgi:hypothetical protein